ncbi:2-hydroxyglutaryl-CoA dehydratase [bacterium]|nr:2-hydroxyglutaryl-CoA dehydratase [bacterium]
MGYYLGIDVGSISTNLVLMDENNVVYHQIYLRTEGQAIKAVKKGLLELRDKVGIESSEILGVGTTGSGRELAGVIVNADIVKDEITAHAVATLETVSPDIRTILEIGGQDSKIIILQDGIPVDFAMNTVCASGTGSMLDNIAGRVGIEIEDIGPKAIKSKNPADIAARCAVFGESDFIHALQMGIPMNDVIAGLCNALVRNYLNNVGKGKEIKPPIVFQGGVSENAGVIKAFEEALEYKLIIPEHNKVMGAVGMCYLAKRKIESLASEMSLQIDYPESGGTATATQTMPRLTKFYGLELIDVAFETKTFKCDGCANMCRIVRAYKDGDVIATWGDRCGKWST